MKVKQIHKNIGVSIEGIDLSKIDENTFKKIKDLWVQYLIVIFPKQNISDEDHIKFGKKFGELEVHPSLSHRSSKNPEIYRVSNVDENGKIIPNKETSWQYLKQSWLWHTDSSFRKIPSNGSILHGISTTNKGGNTLFANMYRAYETLPNELKQKLDGVEAEHGFYTGVDVSEKMKQALRIDGYDGKAIHPVFIRHEETGRTALYVNRLQTRRLIGFEETESRKILAHLFEHSEQTEMIYQHKWTPGDLVAWDNRCTNHARTDFGPDERRLLLRTTVQGVKPCGAVSAS